MNNAQALAQFIQARTNCEQSGNREWLEKWQSKIDAIMNTAPSGSGIDCGTKLVGLGAKSHALKFTADYHHMNDNGMYDGWTSHSITVRASLVYGLLVQIGGRNRNDICDYLADTYHSWLSEEYKE